MEFISTILLLHAPILNFRPCKESRGSNSARLPPARVHQVELDPNIDMETGTNGSSILDWIFYASYLIWIKRSPFSLKLSFFLKTYLPPLVSPIDIVILKNLCSNAMPVFYHLNRFDALQQKSRHLAVFDV